MGVFRVQLQDEILILKREEASPFSYLVREAKLLLEIEIKLLHESTDREALLGLKAQKLQEIQQIDIRLNAEAVTNGTQRIGTIFAAANKTESQNY